MTNEEELKEKLEKQDKICDDLIKQNPCGFYDNEFETLTLLQAELKGIQSQKQEDKGDMLFLIKVAENGLENEDEDERFEEIKQQVEK